MGAYLSKKGELETYYNDDEEEYEEEVTELKSELEERQEQFELF